MCSNTEIHFELCYLQKQKLSWSGIWTLYIQITDTGKTNTNTVKNPTPTWNHEESHSIILKTSARMQLKYINNEKFPQKWNTVWVCRRSNSFVRVLYYDTSPSIILRILKPKLLGLYQHCIFNPAVTHVDQMESWTFGHWENLISQAQSEILNLNSELSWLAAYP